MRDPERNLPRALALGVLGVTFVYVLLSAAFIYVVPIESVGSDETFVAQAGKRIFGPAGGPLLAAIVVACVLGSLAGAIMTSPRVYYAMARDGLFFPGVAAIHPRFGTPARAIALHALVAGLLVALGTFGQIIAYFISVAVIFIGLTVAGLFMIRRRANGSGARSFGYPWTAVLFLTLVAVLLILLAIRSPMQALLGVGVVALGIPFFRLLNFRAAASRDPRAPRTPLE